MRWAKVARVKIRGEFLVLDEDGNVVNVVMGPEAILHHPHGEQLRHVWHRVGLFGHQPGTGRNLDDGGYQRSGRCR